MILEDQVKYTLIIDPEREEEIVICAREKNEMIARIESIINESCKELLGYCGDEIICLKHAAVECFFLEGGRTYAIYEGKKYLVKQRLYQIESGLGNDFLKINQSCIVNVKKIQRFETSIGGALRVRLVSGYSDYVSRRQMKSVKERIGM
jgi:DNA-binding LytR/AlgR family response regulator